MTKLSDKQKEDIKKYNKKYYEDHKEKLNARHRVWIEQNKDTVAISNRKYYARNKNNINLSCKEYYRNNKDSISHRNREYRKKNKEELSLRKKLYDSLPENVEARRERQELHWSSHLLSGIKSSSKRRNIEFNITESDIPDPTGLCCPIFGSIFEMGIRSINDKSATIDRIDNSKGYVPGNIWLISCLANRIKHEADSSLIRKLGQAVLMREAVTEQYIDVTDGTRALRQKMIRYRKHFNRKHHNLEFTIEWFNISVPEFCPCTGNKLDYSNGLKDWRNFATIDRVDNSRGYIPGNVWVISSLANVMKTTANGSQILRVAEFLEKKFDSSV